MASESQEEVQSLSVEEDDIREMTVGDEKGQEEGVPSPTPELMP